MIRMEGRTVVKRPIETVFDFVADVRNEPKCNPGIVYAEQVTDGPIGPGTQFRNVTKGIGRNTEWSIRVTSYERPRQLTLSLRSSAMDTVGLIKFEAVASGTEIHWLWESNPRGIFRLMAPLMKRAAQSFEARNWEHLKHYLEA